MKTTPGGSAGPSRDRSPLAVAMKRFALLLLGLASGALAVEPAPPALHAQVRAFFDDNCVKCHGPKKTKADLRLDRLEADFGSPEAVELWAMIKDSLELGEMPPEEEKQRPTAAQNAALVRWIGAQIVEHHDAFATKAAQPGYGNLLKHEALFSTAPARPGGRPDVIPRLWRISPEALKRVIKSVSGHEMEFRDNNPFELDDPAGSYRDFANRYDIDVPTAERAADWALMAVRFQTGVAKEDGKLVRVDKGKLPPEFARVLDPDAKPSDEDLSAALRWQFRSALRREPAAGEVAPLLALIKKTDTKLGRPAGLQTALAAVVLTPEAVFRFEGVAAPTAGEGAVRLAPREIADALSYALTDLPASDALLKTFQTATGDPREVVAAQARKMIYDSGAAKKKFTRFFLEYFDLEKARNVFKDKKEFKGYWPEVLVEDATHLIEYILDGDREVLREMLTTNKAFVNYGKEKMRRNEPIHLSYNLPADWKYTPEQPIELPRRERAGLLTHPAWLAAFSGNLANDPIRRGKFIRIKLLGGTVPDLPVSVAAQLPTDPALTLREKLRVTADSQCWKCHKKMNDLGLPFEAFDHFGRFRTTELDKPVVTTGTIRYTGDSALERDVANPIELANHLAGSERVRQVFVRNAFRFFLGRNETAADAKTLQDADRAYVESQGSFRALALSLLTSDSFLLRATPKGSAITYAYGPVAEPAARSASGGGGGGKPAAVLQQSAAKSKAAFEAFDRATGAVWLVSFGKRNGKAGEQPAQWNEMNDNNVPPEKTVREWKDTAGRRAMTATIVQRSGSLVPFKGGVAAGQTALFGEAVTDRATGASWSSNGPAGALALELSGLNPAARYVVLPVLSGNDPANGPVEKWSAGGAHGSVYEALAVEGADISTPIAPTTEGRITLTFHFSAGFGSSGLNALGIKELATK